MSLPKETLISLRFTEPDMADLLSIMMEAKTEGRWDDESTMLLRMLAEGLGAHDLKESDRAYAELRQYVE